MTNREFTAAVERGEFPESVAVPLDEPFVNENGSIQNLALEKFTSIAAIHSMAGAIRANHRHKTDWHYAYVVHGEVHYFEVPAEANAAIGIDAYRFRKGDLFFTRPTVDHAMYFPVDTTIITLAKNIRDTEHHEEDVERPRKLIMLRASYHTNLMTSGPINWRNA